MTAGSDSVTAQTDKPGSMPWWAQEMGMTEEEYWSGLHSNTDYPEAAAGLQQEAARKVEVSQVLMPLFWSLAYTAGCDALHCSF